MINKDVRKYLACKNGNAILIWRWNNPVIVPWYWEEFGLDLLEPYDIRHVWLVAVEKSLE